MIVRGTLEGHNATREAWATGELSVDEVEGGDAALVAGSLVTIVGDRLGLAEPGERLELEGELEKTERWGYQFRIERQTSLGIRNAGEAARFLERLDGVGPKLAKAIGAALGEDLVAVLSGELERDLTDIDGVGVERARLILESFQRIGQSGDLEELQFLDGLGATRWMTGQVLKFAKRKKTTPRELLASAPYDLLEVKGLGWNKVDHLARVTGTPAEAPARLEAGSMVVLDEEVDRGSTMIRLGHLMRKSVEALGVEGGPIHDAIQRCAASGRVILSREGETVWVHPKALYRAERLIYKAATASRKQPTTEEKTNTMTNTLPPADEATVRVVLGLPTKAERELEPDRLGLNALLDATANADVEW